MRVIVFVTDGGGEMGMGHVQQSLTLAEALRGRADIQFLTRSDETVVNQIEASGFPVTRRGSDGELLAILEEIKPQLVIIDKIDVAMEFARKIREELAIKLAIFTNITAANRYAHIAVTADYGSSFKNVKYLDENTQTFYYYGPRYWILRKEFYEGKKKAGDGSSQINTVLLIFGGSDPLNLTTVVLDALLGLPQEFLINVILGAGFRFQAELEETLGKHEGLRGNVHIFRNIKNVAELMREADLVLASPGLSLFEALAVGTPAIAFHQNGLQAEAYRGLIPTVDKSEIGELPAMLEERRFIDPYDPFIVNLEIGEGKEELVEILLKDREKGTNDNEMGKERTAV